MRINLKVKNLIFIIGVAIFFSMASIMISRTIINDLVDEFYSERAEELASMAAVSIDPDNVAVLRDEVLKVYRASSNYVTSDDWGTPEFDAYVKQYEHIQELPEYEAVLVELREMQDSVDVDCMYLAYIDLEHNNFIYLCDAAEEDPCPVGCLDSYYDIGSADFFSPEKGLDPNITNTEAYGWLVTAGRTVRDSDGEIAGYSCVDISMDAIRARQQRFVITIAIVLIGITILMCILAYILVQFMAVRPIRRLSDMAMKYVKRTNDTEWPGFTSLNIRTGDEIEDLSEALKMLEQDIMDYKTDLKVVREELDVTRHLVDEQNYNATVDPLTGVRNRAAYDMEVTKMDQQLNAERFEFGVALIDLNFLKRVNDCFGEDKGDEALMKLCGIICNQFEHSPVFRIGGDEFAIILRNGDYDDAPDLIDGFRDTMERLSVDEEVQPWERIKAMLGYAFYDPLIDTGVESVYQRAEMDLLKQKQKEHRKQ